MNNIRWDAFRQKLKTSTTIIRFLRDNANMTKREAQEQLLLIVEKMRQGKIPTNLKILKENFIPAIKEKNPIRHELFNLIVNLIDEEEDKYGFETDIKAEIFTETEKFEMAQEIEKFTGIIGRVSITKVTPATPYRFSFWVKYSPDIHISPGSMVYIKLGQNKDYAVALVENTQSVTDTPDPITSYYSWSYGEPHQEMPTLKPIIRHCDARIIYRTDKYTEPFLTTHEVYLADASQIEEAFCSNISNENKILLGFTTDAFGTMVPIYGDYRYIFGYKAGHVNIAGKSGVAGKTSYALFLIASALGMLQNYQTKWDSVSFIAFNVKERDLLNLNHFEFDDISSAISHLQERGQLEDAAMWEKAKINEIDPIKIFKNNTKFFEPGMASRMFNYGLQDILTAGFEVFMSLFEPTDLDEKMESLIISIAEEFNDGRTSFKQLQKKLKEKLSSGSGARSDYIAIGEVLHHKLTLTKFLNRLNKILIKGNNLINIDNSIGSPPRISDLVTNELWVIDIKPLPDNCKRFVFLSILKYLDKILEAKKEGHKCIRIGKEDIDLTTFPSRVSVFIDELNKFAPSAAFRSSIKQPIIDIVARGRSIGLSLIGAQQLASQIDEEILVNTSTFLVGKQEPVELLQKAYRWIPDGFKERVSYLRTGEMILYHERHNGPVIIRFPIPLHKTEE